MKRDLEVARQRKYVGAAELANETAAILVERGPVQERGTVTEVPDERTIRYYLAEGLLSPAEDKQGTASVFGYLHLLQVLVVKKLQAEHLPIRKIRDLVTGRTERQLERLLGSGEERGTKAANKNEAVRYLESLLTKPSAPTAVARRGPEDGGTGRPATTEMRRFQVSAPETMNSSLPLYSLSAPSSATPSGEVSETWERLEIEPGLELHIRGNYQPPTNAGGLRRLANFILRVVNTIGQKPGKRGSS